MAATGGPLRRSSCCSASRLGRAEPVRARRPLRRSRTSSNPRRCHARTRSWARPRRPATSSGRYWAGSCSAPALRRRALRRRRRDVRRLRLHRRVDPPAVRAGRHAGAPRRPRGVRRDRARAAAAAGRARRGRLARRHRHRRRRLLPALAAPRRRYAGVRRDDRAPRRRRPARRRPRGPRAASRGSQRILALAFAGSGDRARPRRRRAGARASHSVGWRSRAGSRARRRGGRRR